MKEYCEDQLYNDVFAAVHKYKDAPGINILDITNDIVKQIQPGFGKHLQDKAELSKELKTAVKYLAEGKKIFMPHTTNSFVDDFLSKHKDLLEEKE